MTGWLADVLRIFAEDDRANPAEKKRRPDWLKPASDD
jgi:hypothetical protein